MNLQYMIMLSRIIILVSGSICCHGGLTGTLRPLVAISFALVFSVVMLLIADLDSPRRGSLSVSQQALEDFGGQWANQPAD